MRLRRPWDDYILNLRMPKVQYAHNRSQKDKHTHYLL